MSRLLKQSSTQQPLLFFLADSSDHNTGKTGLSPTVTLSKAGGSFAAPSGAVTEIANGWYKVAGNATDTNAMGPLVLHATATGADATDVLFEIVAFDPQDAVRLGLSALANAAVGTPFGLPRVQDIAQIYERNPGGGKVYYVAKNGNDANDGLAPKTIGTSGPFLTLAACQAVVAVRDTVVMGPGIFNEGANAFTMLDHMKLIGAGSDRTTIQSTAYLSGGGGPIVNLGCKGPHVEGLTIQGTAASGVSQSPIGSQFTALVGTANIVDVRLIADTDILFFQVADSAAVVNCYRLIANGNYDAVRLWVGGTTVNLYEPTLVLTGPSTVDSGTKSRAIAVDEGTVNVFGGSITVSNATTQNYGTWINGTSTTGIVNLYGTRISTSGTGAKDIQADAGTVNAYGAVYDKVKTGGAGTINHLASGVNWGNIVSPGATQNLGATTIKNATDISAKTDNLPADPADASDIAGSFSTVNTTLGAIAGYIDTEVGAIKVKTDNLPADPASNTQVLTRAAPGDAMTLTAAYTPLLDTNTLISNMITTAGGNPAWNANAMRFTPVVRENFAAGTVINTTGATTTLDTSAVASDSYYLQESLRITAGPGAGQERIITAYTVGRVASHDPWTVNPDNTSDYEISPARSSANVTLTPQNIQDIADGVAAEVSSGAGNGDTPIDHNFGGVDALRVMHSGQAIDGATIRAYVAAAFDAGIVDPIPPTQFTGSDGRWIGPLMLDPDNYVLTISHPTIVTKVVRILVS